MQVHVGSVGRLETCTSAWIKPRFETGPRVLSFPFSCCDSVTTTTTFFWKALSSPGPPLPLPSLDRNHGTLSPAHLHLPSQTRTPPVAGPCQPSSACMVWTSMCRNLQLQSLPPQRTVRLDTLTPIHPPAIAAPCRATALVNPRQSDTLLQPIATGTNQPQPIYTYIFLHWCITAILCIDSHSRRAYSPASDGKKSPPHSPPLPNSRTAAPAP